MLPRALEQVRGRVGDLGGSIAARIRDQVLEKATFDLGTFGEEVDELEMALERAGFSADQYVVHRNGDGTAVVLGAITAEPVEVAEQKAERHEALVAFFAARRLIHHRLELL